MSYSPIARFGKKILVILFFIFVVFFVVKKEKSSREKKVFILQTIEHPALNKTVQGILEKLKEHDKNIQVKIESAQGNQGLANQIVSKFVAQKPDVIVGIGTLAAQSISRFAKEGKTNLVFSSVTDPLGSGLIKSFNFPGNNTSGVSNFVPLGPQIQAFKDIIPGLKRLGVLFSPTELNSLHINKELELIAEKFGLTLEKIPVMRIIDLPLILLKALSKIDAVFISNDNPILNNLPLVLRITRNKIPVFISDVDAVNLGCLAAVGPDQEIIGKQTAEIIIKVLNHGDINRIPVQFPTKILFFYNQKVAKNLQIESDWPQKNQALVVGE